MPKRAVRQYQFPKGLDQSLYDHLTPTTLAYIGGLIDGEGCIGSSHPLHNRKPLQINVTMIHKPTIEWLWRTCGGSLVGRRSNQKGARQGWSWIIKGVRTYSLLRKILPFMVTKREEAETAIELGATLWTDNVRGQVTEEVLARRRELGQKLRDLKRREWPA